MIYSKKLSQFGDLIHGFTTKEEGDFRFLRRALERREVPQKTYGVASLCGRGVVLPEQVHGKKVAIVRNKDKDKVIKDADGLVAKEKGVTLGIMTADCLPILFYEPKKKIIGIVHAGWKGALKKIASSMVKKIKELGGTSSEIIVAIGPHIKSCCYDIDKKRALIFKKEFGQEVIRKKKDKLFLNLTKVNLVQLFKDGIEKKNIEISPFCTSCNQNLFFSYRKKKENYGEMLSFIGLV